MAFDLSGLSAYVDELKNDLIRRGLMNARTVQEITVQSGIKSSATINILGSTQVWQAGGCGFNASGTTALTQREISVCAIKKNESLCIDDLEAYYTQKMMKAGSYNEEIPFEALYAEEVVKQTEKFVEKLSWRGDVSLPVSNELSLCDGLLKIIDAEGDVIVVTGETLDAAGIVDAIDAMVASLPEDVAEAEDLKVFLSIPDYRTYSKALRDANLFHYTGAENQGGEFRQPVPGSANVSVVGVGGMVTGRAVLAESANLVMGTDLLNDYENFKISYDVHEDDVKVIQKMKVGFQVAFPERIVTI